MITKITIKSKKANDMLARLGGNISNLRPALVQIGGMLEGASDDAFRKQGPGWKPLKASTKRERGSSGPILNRRGGRGLVGSVTSEVRGDTVYIGSNLPYARIHQLGGTIKHPGGTKYLVIGGGLAVFLKNSATEFTGITKPHDITLPARPYLIIGLKQEKQAAKLLTKHLLRGI